MTDQPALAPSAALGAAERALRKWKLLTVGLLLLLTAGLTGGGWYVSRVQKNARTIHLEHGTTLTLVDRNGVSHEIRYEEKNGILRKVTVYRDQNGRKLGEVRSLEDAFQSQMALGQ